EEGEWVRLRGERYVIGRSEGDIRIPDDGLMSARHAELSRQRLPTGVRWALHDLNSTNGTFVRIGGTPLVPGQQLLVGHTHLRLEAGPAAGDGPAPTALVGVGRSARRFPLAEKVVWIGRDPACGVCLADDPCVSPKHARLSRDRKGRWRVENNKSRNGLWLRIEQITLDTACQFQLGEQRFVF